MEFKEYIKEANLKFKELQDNDKEVVSVEDKDKALEILDKLEYKTIEDYFIGCSAINLLNTYVKQGSNKKTFGYGFKRNCNRMVKYYLENTINGLVVKPAFDENIHMKVLYFIFEDEIMFSFHGVNLEEEEYTKLSEINKDKKLLDFDGIRKQKCAVTVFNYGLKLYN